MRPRQRYCHKPPLTHTTLSQPPSPSSSFSSSKAPRDSANAASTVEQIAETVKSAEPDRRVLDVRGAPGVDQLSAKEVELCSLLRLLPKHYLIIRDAVVAECLAAGALPKEQAHQLINIGARPPTPSRPVSRGRSHPRPSLPRLCQMPRARASS